MGDEFPVFYKLNGDDYMDEGEGMTSGEAREVFKRLDGLGVDMFELSGYNESSGRGLGPARKGVNSREKESYFLEGAAKTAADLKAPVILMGGNRSPVLMEEILNKTEIACFSLGRPLLCEPDLIRRWEREPGYRPKCVSCNRCWETSPNSCLFNR